MENQLRDPIIAVLLNLDKNDFIDVSYIIRILRITLIRKTEITFLFTREILTEYNLMTCTCALDNKLSEPLKPTLYFLILFC